MKSEPKWKSGSGPFAKSTLPWRFFFPFWFLLLTALPTLVSFIIDYKFASGRYLIINFTWATAFLFLHQLLFKRWFYYTGVATFALLGALELFHWCLLGTPPTTTSLLVTANTNYQEALEFMELKGGRVFLLFLPYLATTFMAFREAAPKKLLAKYPLLYGSIALAMLVFFVENGVNQRFMRKASPRLVNLCYVFVDEISFYREVLEEKRPKALVVQQNADAEQHTFVLILGESMNKRHLSLYGYPLTTTPKLKSRADLLVYNDVVSSYSNTIQSVLAMLTTSNLENTLVPEQSVDIIDVFYSAGFETHWISNQSPVGLWENVITVFANKADHRRFVNTTSNTSFESTLSISYDEKLFEPFQEALSSSASKKLIVVHLMGSHSAYAKRYPSRFEQFPVKGSDVEKTKAAYDNSILYTDYIVDSLFNAISHFSRTLNNACYTALFVSDHGENVYDEAGGVGHDHTGQLLRAHVEVPLLVWLPETYRIRYPEKTQQLLKQRSLPFVTDDLFHAILDLNFIDVKEFDGKRSLFNPAFNKTRQRILEDGHDYDLQPKRHNRLKNN
jgi:heptose-I-phosphate ethanolaminephosphotransferase